MSSYRSNAAGANRRAMADSLSTAGAPPAAVNNQNGTTVNLMSAGTPETTGAPVSTFQMPGAGGVSAAAPQSTGAPVSTFQMPGAGGVSAAAPQSTGAPVSTFQMPGAGGRGQVSGYGANAAASPVTTMPVTSPDGGNPTADPYTPTKGEGDQYRGGGNYNDINPNPPTAPYVPPAGTLPFPGAGDVNPNPGGPMPPPSNAGDGYNATMPGEGSPGYTPPAPAQPGGGATFDGSGGINTVTPGASDPQAYVQGAATGAPANSYSQKGGGRTVTGGVSAVNPQATGDAFGNVDGYIDQSFNNAMTRLQPQLDAQRDQLAQSLVNRGISVGSEAYSKAMAQMSQSQNDAVQNAQFQSMRFGTDLQDQMFQQDNARSQLSNALLQAQMSEGVERDQLTESARQFDAGQSQDDRQFGARLGEEQRQFSDSLAEQMRQFNSDDAFRNSSFGTETEQRNLDRAESQRQFDGDTAFRYAGLGEDSRQFDNRLGLDFETLNSSNFNQAQNRAEDARQFDTNSDFRASEMMEQMRQFDNNSEFRDLSWSEDQAFRANQANNALDYQNFQMAMQLLGPIYGTEAMPIDIAALQNTINGANAGVARWTDALGGLVGEARNRNGG